MKKIITFSVLLCGWFLAFQLSAQVNSNTYHKQPTSEHYQNPNANNTGKYQKNQTGTGKDQMNQTGTGKDHKNQTGTGKDQKAPAPAAGQSESGATYTIPGETKPGPTTETGSVTSTKKTGTHIYDKSGEIMAKVEADGTVRDSRGKAIARCADNGDYFGPSGDKIGTIKDGVIRNMEGIEAGRIGEDGKVTDAKGKLLGTIDDDGTILNSKGSKLGSAPGVNKNISAMIFFNNKKLSSDDKKQQTQTQSGSDAKPIEKK
jgi:hypothetical protein